MIKLAKLTILLLLVMLSSDALAIDLAEWKYQADVIIEDYGKQYCTVILTPGIYSAATADLRDIRLINIRDEQVPYVLFKPEDDRKKVKYSPTMINRSTKNGRASLITLDFGKRHYKNSIDVVTEGHNFRRTVAVEGSNDNIEFFTLVRSAYVFAVPDGLSRQFSRIDLPTNDYRYLRVTVWSMAGETEPPIIKEIKILKIERTNAERLNVSLSSVPYEPTKEEKINNLSFYVFDLGYTNLPITEIELEVAEDSFYRHVILEGRDQASRRVKIHTEDNRELFREVKVDWTRIVSNTIYSYSDEDGQKRKKLILHIPRGRKTYRYLRIVVRNYDDKPITIESASAKMIAAQLIFAAEDADSMTPVDDKLMLYVGCEQAQRPHYDLQHRLDKPSQIKAGGTTIAKLVPNALFGQTVNKQIPWTEKHKVLLLVVMAVVVIILAGFILKSLSSIRKQEA